MQPRTCLLSAFTLSTAMAFGVATMAADLPKAADAKSYSGKFTFTTGTGKYAGISGGGTFTCHSPDFRTAAEGTYAQYCTDSGSYKLP
jgi:hypothetical protein